MTAAERRLPTWLGVLFLALLAIGTDEFAIAGLLPEVAADLDVSVSAAGQLVTVFAVVYAVGAPLLSLVTDRLPRRTVITVGLALFVVANVAAAVAAGYWILMAARVLSALGAAVVSSTAFAAASEGAPQGQQGRYLAVTVAGITVALFTGVPVGAWLASTYDWRTAFWLIATVGLVVAVGARLSMPAIPGSTATPLRQRLAALRDWTIARSLTVTLLGATGGLMFYNYLAPFAAATAAPSSGLLVTLLFTVGVAGVAGAWLGGRSTDVLGPRRALRLVMCGHALALVAIASLQVAGLLNPWSLVATVAVWSVFAWSFNPPLQGVLLAVAPQTTMTVLALNISAMYLGTGAGGALGGLVVDALGAQWVPVFSAVLLSCAVALVPRTDASHDTERTVSVPSGAPAP